MPDAIRITYRHVLGCLPCDCPRHSLVMRTSMDVEAAIRVLTESDSDFPIEVEGVEDVPDPVQRPVRSG